MTQEQLAKECKINTRYLGKLENGIHTPTLDVLIKLLPGLGVSLTEFSNHYEKWFRMIRRVGLDKKHSRPRFEDLKRIKTRFYEDETSKLNEPRRASDERAGSEMLTG